MVPPGTLYTPFNIIPLGEGRCKSIQLLSSPIFSSLYPLPSLQESLPDTLFRHGQHENVLLDRTCL